MGNGKPHKSMTEDRLDGMKDNPRTRSKYSALWSLSQEAERSTIFYDLRIANAEVQKLPICNGWENVRPHLQRLSI